MRGWTAEGREITLTTAQESAVRQFLAWDHGHRVLMVQGWGRGAGKTTVLVTVARYAEARAKGEPLPGDPLLEGAGDEPPTA